MDKPNFDINEFRDIVVRYQDRMFRFAFMRIGIKEAAEDIVQEVFIRLLRSMRSSREITNPELYLLRSINNACINYLRDNRMTMVQLLEADYLESESAGDIDDEFRRINLMLRTLPYEQAETIRLKCHDELTFRQIAELHGIPEATVKSRYRYGIATLRKNLNNYE